MAEPETEVELNLPEVETLAEVTEPEAADEVAEPETEVELNLPEVETLAEVTEPEAEAVDVAVTDDVAPVEAITPS